MDVECCVINNIKIKKGNTIIVSNSVIINDPTFNYKRINKLGSVVRIFKELEYTLIDLKFSDKKTNTFFVEELTLPICF